MRGELAWCTGARRGAGFLERGDQGWAQELRPSGARQIISQYSHVDPRTTARAGTSVVARAGRRAFGHETQATEARVASGRDDIGRRCVRTLHAASPAITELLNGVRAVIRICGAGWIPTSLPLLRSRSH